jgi:Protein kinase domain/Bacterial RNA polymerase, alpha chain C terminal domain
LSTHPDVTLRIGSMDEFLSRLAEVEKELSLPPAEPTVDPADAKAGDRSEGGFKVVARLGRGASADALLVTRSGEDDLLVLKIAIDRQHNDRINDESEILKKLHDHNIVSLRDTLTIAGRSALLLDRAGDETLAQRMRKEPLSLDLIRRFGEELLSAVNYLEQEGVPHRDIKPENIGIARTGQKGQLRLILFDFSLARTPIDNIRAGTRRHLDPFLSLRHPPRWDLAAERYAVAVTLYEMLTGTVPVWGDGRSDAALLDCEVTIDEDRFDPQLRDGLSDFFGKAFRRDPKERFDNAEEMLRGWRHVFDRAHLTSIEAHEFSAIARATTADTSVRELGYSVEALNVLDRMGIQTVRQLLAVDRVKFRYLTNVGDRVRKEIRLRAKELAVLGRDLARGQPSIVNGDEDRAAVSSIDRLAEQLLPRRPAGADLPEDRALATYLGMEGEFSTAWPTIGDASSKCDMSREALTSALVKAWERWSKQPGITEIRNDLAPIVNRTSRLARTLG